jgi:hypothetical protein
MLKVLTALSCLPLLAGLTSAPAEAQSVCGEHSKLLSALADKFDEMPQAFGLAGEQALVELLVSKTGSWTMVMTRPSGMTCILATGQSWDQYPDKAKMTGL